MCTQDQIVLGPTGFPITSGSPQMNFDRGTFQWSNAWRSLGIGLILLNGVACSAFVPRGDLKVSDLQLTVDVLNASLEDAQHGMADLRAEVEVQTRELAETQVIRAQLEGRVREAEHRLSEARQVIGLQREELAQSRAERDRMTRTGVVLQSQLKQLRKQLSRIERQTSGGVSPTIMDLPAGQPVSLVPVGLKEAVLFDDAPEGRRALPQSDEAMSDATSVDRGGILAHRLVPATHTRIMIKHGDTLWSLAQRHRTSVHQLMAINALATDYIQAGQSLWLPESVADESEYERR